MEIVGVVVAVLSFVYMVIWGQKSIGDILRKRRQRAQAGQQGGPKAPQVFISYSRKDSAFVEKLAWDLKASGLEVWYDLSGLKVGARWGTEIQRAIRDSQYCVVILSPNAVVSEWVEREFLFASQSKLKIVPILHAPCDLPLWAIDMQYIDMQGAKYQENLRSVVGELGAAPAEPLRPQIKKAPLVAVANQRSRFTSEHPGPIRPMKRDGRPAARLLARMKTRQVYRALGAAVLAGGLILLVIFAASRRTLPQREQDGMATALSAEPAYTVASTVAAATAPHPAAIAPHTATPGWMPTTTRTETVPPTMVPVGTLVPGQALSPALSEALAEITSRQPDFETTFDDTGPYSYPPLYDNAGLYRLPAVDNVSDARVERGVLVIAGLGGERGELYLYEAPSEEFVVDFAIRKLGAEGNCGFHSREGAGDNKTMSVMLNGRHSVAVDYLRVPDVEGAGATLEEVDWLMSNRMTVIVLRQEVAVLLNQDQPLVISAGAGRTYNKLSLLAGGGSSCEFQDFRLWQLQPD